MVLMTVSVDVAAVAGELGFIGLDADAYMLTPPAPALIRVFLLIRPFALICPSSARGAARAQ
jgi:hypothetical protein